MGHVHRIAASLLVLVSAGGCRSVFGLDDPLPGDPGGPVDAPADGPPVDMLPLCSTFGLTCAGTAVAFACGQTCWVGCTDTVSHSTADTRCNNWHGKLAPFVTTSDQDCFRQHIQPTGDSWTGLVQMATATMPADLWSWNGNGLPPPFFNWDANQPDDGDMNENDTEQCAQILDGTDKWQDVPCGSASQFPFACSTHIDD